MTTVRITVLGGERFQHSVDRLAWRVGEPIVALNRIADDMMKVIGNTFTSQGRRYGGSWQALDKATIREKARKHQDPRALIASGALMRSYTQRSSPDQVLHVTPSGITLESLRDYGEYHQLGAGENPKREFIKFYPPDRARWTKMIERELMAAYRGSVV